MAAHGSGNDQRHEAFAELAKELGFTITRSSFEVGEHADIGLFGGLLATAVMDVDLSPSQRPLGAQDDSEIEHVIRGWESLEPTAYHDDFTDFAADPYMIVMADAVGQVSASSMEGSSEFEELLAKYPVHSPRDVTVSNIQIVHIGGFRAVATYVVDESYTDGRSFHGNAFALLARLRQGWRIVIATDHIPH